MINEIRSYYEKNGMSAMDFHCTKFAECSRFSPEKFTTSKEAFISSGYEKHISPRILFLSLDSGSASNNPAEKTLESIQQQEEFDCNVMLLPKNKHWYRTHELAYVILKNFKPDIKIEDTKHYFAHTNSAKCCQNNQFRGQASSIMFDNCREFIPGEIEILQPDILVTQGDWAKKAIEKQFEELAYQKVIPFPSSPPDEAKIIQILSRPVMWIHTYHPRNPTSKLNRDHYPLYEKCTYEFINKKPFPKEIQINKDAQKTERITMNQPRKNKEHVVAIVQKEDQKELNYIFLGQEPKVPPEKTPTRAECAGYEYMTMVQLCNIGEKYEDSRSKACNAFGGDKGKKKVITDRMARVFYIGKKLKKYVLVSAVKGYFVEKGINW